MYKRNINKIVIFGDSLSDFNRMHSSNLGKFSKFFNQIHYSPEQRFSDGFVWGDWLTPYLFREQFNTMSSTEIMNEAEAINYRPYSIKIDDNCTDIKIYNYAKGGATASDFSQMNKGNFVSKHFLDNLSEQFKLFKNENVSTPPNKSDFSETLFFIWAGANDFITAGWQENTCSDSATDAIIQLISDLIELGAKNFVAFNLPDFSMTPRFRNMSNIKNSNSAKEFEYLSNRFNFDLKRKLFHMLFIGNDEIITQTVILYKKFNALAYAIIKASKKNNYYIQYDLIYEAAKTISKNNAINNEKVNLNIDYINDLILLMQDSEEQKNHIIFLVSNYIPIICNESNNKVFKNLAHSLNNENKVFKFLINSQELVLYLKILKIKEKSITQKELYSAIISRRIINFLNAYNHKTYFDEFINLDNNDEFIKHYALRIDLIDVHNIMKELDSNEFKKIYIDNMEFNTPITIYKEPMTNKTSNINKLKKLKKDTYKDLKRIEEDAIVELKRLKKDATQKLKKFNRNSQAENILIYEDTIKKFKRTKKSSSLEDLILNEEAKRKLIDLNKNLSLENLKKYEQDNSSIINDQTEETYAFHDDVHPSKYIHHLLGVFVAKNLIKSFNFKHHPAQQ